MERKDTVKKEDERFLNLSKKSYMDGCYLQYLENAVYSILGTCFHSIYCRMVLRSIGVYTKCYDYECSSCSTSLLLPLPVTPPPTPPPPPQH